MKNGNRKSRRFRVGLFSWFVMGAVVIFAAVFTVITLQNLEKQKEQTTRLLVEKGEALIRSFEAGARTGAGMRWSAFQLQKLLIETAQQPGIDYIIVADTAGTILVDSDPARVGEIYGTDLNLKRIAGLRGTAWRQVPNTEGADTFEVYGQFAPTKEPFAGFEGTAGPEKAAGFVIFVGLDMGPILTLRKADEQQTVWIAVVLLLIGCAGVASLFLAYRYSVAQASLSKVRAFSDHLVENMPIGLVAVDNAGQIAAFNSAASSLLHLPVPEALGRPAWSILPAAWRGLAESIVPGGKVVERELDCTLPGGKTVPLAVIASILEEEGKAQGLVILFRDLTEIISLKEEVARSQRLAALGNLAAGVAHEIRNPLSSIKGFATYFKERYRDIPEDRQTAEIMVNEVERLNRVISQLLEFARPMSLNNRKTSLSILIHHTLRMIEDQAKARGIALQADEVTDAELFVDPDKITQVFLNLLLNAMAAMENGGILTIRAFPAGNRFTRVVIADTGTGIAKEDLARVFDPYFTTKPAGTGLGLAIVHKIVEAHGGEVSVESDPARGTMVTLTLPLEEVNSER